jgi:hypothetical protein
MTRALRVLLAGALLLLLPSCVRMPTEGPVVESSGTTGGDAAPGIYFDPAPPQAGESATEIVTHFLEAMKAAPIKTSVARQFLTARAQETWAPEKSIITYAEIGDPLGELDVFLPATDINEYDDRGAWQSTRPEATLHFTLTTENGEWRIDEVPDALMVPASWFADWFRRVSLYYFDPTAQILVPEPVFVPEGDQFAYPLVRGLLAPPSGDAARVTRTFFPPGFRLGLSVPISAAGIAEVTLLGDPALVDEQTGTRILTQLIYTLRQESRIRAVRVTIGDRELGLPGGPTQVNLDVGSLYDPNGVQASGDLFGLVDGRLVRGSVDSLLPTPGPMGAERLGVRSIGVNLAGSRVAGISGNGRSVLVAPVDDEDGRAVEVVSGATSLLSPAWDFADRIWLADRARGHARISVVVGNRPRTIEVPGISGRDVRQLLVSRDGSRLVAVVRTGQGDTVVASRVLHDDQGRVLRTTKARRLAVDPDASGVIRDIGWRSPTAISVLTDITDDLSQVRTVSVDGAPGELATVGSSRLRGSARALVSSPVEGAEVYAVAAATAADLTAPERTQPPLPDGLQGLTYVG